MVATTNVGEAADVAQNLSKMLRLLSLASHKPEDTQQHAKHHADEKQTPHARDKASANGHKLATTVGAVLRNRRWQFSATAADDPLSL